MAREALNTSLSGKLALVTGATGGIGKEIARGLARLGADVLIGARDASRGEAARADIVSSTRNDRVWVMTVDVSDLTSVRVFAEAFRQRHPRLDVLVNNAGVWSTDRRESADGYELTFATNVLGPHLLTSLLLEPLRGAGAARILNVVSAFAGSYDIDDLNFTRRKWDGFKAYTQSKQALRMLTWGLAKRLEGTAVTANAVSPGFVKTDFNRNARGFRAAMINLSARLFAVSSEEGADTPVWAAVAPELATVSGRYLEGRKEKERKFDDPAAIAQLEHRCNDMVTRSGQRSEPGRR
jgi:NAD(P)-dependent dehydrogenase (short-subunit alcohol dehydrogenase family)